MKLVIAIIQPTKLKAVREALDKIEVARMTVCDAQGFGRQRGQTEMYRGHEYSTHLLRKIALEIVVNDDFLDRTVETIEQRRPHRPGRDHRRRQDLRAAGPGGDPDRRRRPRHGGRVGAAGERRGVSPTCEPDVHVGLTPRRSPQLKSAVIGEPSATLCGRPRWSRMWVAGSMPSRQKTVAARSAGVTPSAAG